MALKCLEPTTIGRMRLGNRLVFAPMVTSFGDEQGFVTDRLVAYAVERAKGGVGLFELEATYVDPVGKGFGRGIGIDADDKIPGLTRLTSAVHAAGGAISVEIHHAGRETSSSITHCPIVAPSNCPVAYSDEPVHVLQEDEIAAIVRRFAEGALRAVKAGFDAVEIHGAHGYLLTQFLSPYTNKRQDAYGGTFAKRLRFSLEVIKAVREAVGPDFPVTFRMTVEEGVPGGLSLQEGALAAREFSLAGLDAIHIVAGNYASHALVIPPACEGYETNRSRAIAVREAVGPDFPLIVAGRIKNVFQAEDLIQSGIADFVAMGRGLLADPFLPALSSAGQPAAARNCLGCNDGCAMRTGVGLDTLCAVNPRVGFEADFPLGEPAPVSKKVLVSGAGPAGLEAAWVAAQRGHTVVLYERASVVGGQFRLASMPPHKQDLSLYIEAMRQRLLAAGVALKLDCEVTETVIQAEKPDHVLLATGGQPINIAIPGLETLPHMDYAALLRGGLAGLGQRVAVIGGGLVGCEVAEVIATTGREVAIVEMLDNVAQGIHPVMQNLLLGRLEALRVQVWKNHKVLRIQDAALFARDADGEERRIGPVDAVIMAVGICPYNPLEDILKQLKIPYALIGDCQKAGRVLEATQAAIRAAWRV